MSKAIQGAAELGGALATGAAMFLEASTGVGIAAIPFEMKAMAGLVALGVASEACALASVIGQNTGVGVTTRSAAQCRQIVRGEQRIPGTIVYCSTTGSTKRQYNLVIVLATHPINGIVNLYLDGRRVFWNTSSAYNQTVFGNNFGGDSDSNNHTGPNGQQYNFGGEVFCAAFYGMQTSAPTVVGGSWVGPSVISSPTATYPGFCSALQANDATWSPASASGQGTASASSEWNLLGGGEIDALILQNPGFGYADGPVAVTITDLGGAGTGATATASASGGSITSLTLTAGGANYTNPLITFDPPSSVEMTPYLAGCTYVYLKIEADSGNFPALPEIRFTVQGKNDIWDPRTSSTGYTTNWALHIADAITDPTWGLGDNTVNQDQLIAAANVCDELVPCAGGVEARYAVHWHYDTSTSPGDAIARMMDAGGGRLSRIGGEWYIWPAYWQGPSFTFDANALVDSIQWTPKRPMAELCNRVNGTYIAPNFPYNIAGNLYDQNGYFDGATQNNFSYAFQPTNYPPYACDQLHGYGDGVDVYLTQDGGIRLPHELAQECVLSISQAQRLAKIHLLRNRQQGSGTFPMSLAAWQMQPVDVMTFNMPALGWTAKVLEITSVKFRMTRAEGDTAPSSTLEVGVQETDASVYEWEQTEELTVYDVPVATNNAATGSTVQPPTSLAAVSDLATALVQPDGTVTPRIELTWTEPADTYVTNGGSIEIQMTPHGTGAWVDVLLLGGQATSAFIANVTSGNAYDLRIRSVRPSGAASAWVEIDNITCGPPLSALTFSDLSGTAAPGQLPAATTGALGAVKVGSGLNVSGGVLSVSPFSSDPTALAAPSGASTYTIGNGTPFVPASPAASLYFVNGSKKIYGVYYTISGSTLSFLTGDTPQTGDTHEIYCS